MTTRSLILSPHEISAALAGTLGLVVRPVKPQPEYQDETGRWTFCVSSSNKASRDKWSYCVIDDDGHTYTERGRERCVLSLRDPFGVPGTKLVCKETWAHDALSYPHFQESMAGIPKGKIGMFGPYFHADAGPDGFNERGNWLGGMEWRSPATMPAWASRITLEVVGVRCVRCTDLSYADALKCGSPDGAPGALVELERFWAAKYGTHYPWDTSWAWAVGVRRVEG